MSSQGEWICDGEPKNNKKPYYTSGPHAPQTNTSPYCSCGLDREAMDPPGKQGGKRNTTVSMPSNLKPIAIAAIVALIVAGGGFAAYKLIDPGKEADSGNGEEVVTSGSAFISENAANAQFISEGEKILVNSTPAKEAAAQAFAAQDWDSAIQQYETAASEQQNDPESKIYLNNAKARQAGNSLAIAVVVPLSTNPDAAQEVLRGAGLYQEQYNQNPQVPGQLLEIAIADEAGSSSAASLADDFIGATQMLGILGHGVGTETEQAIRLYESEQLAVLSPINTDVTENAGRSLLKIVPLDLWNDELLKSYLQAVAGTLTEYVKSQTEPVSAVVFYDGNNRYGMGLQQAFQVAIQLGGGTLIEALDVSTTGFDPAVAIAQAAERGATSAFLAMSKDSLSAASQLIQANAQSSNPLTVVGGDELYSPAILVESGDSVAGLVLAVPWSFQSNDDFAQKAYDLWKGRVSWRTAAAYDATQALVTAIAQNPNRAEVYQLLQQGVTITGTNTDFTIFKTVPLVQAIEGSSGPPGSNYQFDPLP